MTDLLFSTPWWLPTAIIVAGVFLFVTGNARQLSGPRNVGLGLVGLAIVLILVSWLVETDRERVTRQSRELIKSVETRDWNKMRSLLDPKVSLAISSATIYANRDDLVKGAQAATDQYGLKNIIITSLDAEQTQTVITVTLTALTEQDASMGRPVPSTWQFDWEQIGKDWSLYRITCLRINNEQGPEMRGRFPK
ncbi:MAG TPA: hypothetical protein VLI90_11420 [Tepidisphaeraceae bacterium]|nr:hypothetical protein [Tepidisphaeraceae bacterium]